MNHEVHIFTDGAAKGNPGNGGYGIVMELVGKAYRKEFYEGFRLTTNNRMELLAVITGLKAITKKELPVVVYSDSQYVVRAIEEGWLRNWMKTNFKGGKKNKDLWTRYFHLAQKMNVKLKWVKGHADNPYNNRCDELATTAADGKDLAIDEGYEEAQASL